MRADARLAVVALAAAALAQPACRPAADEPVDPFPRGPAIAYSGYRAGQSPAGGELPSQAQITEDLRILERHWKLIRVYAADRHGEDVLEVIRREGIDLDVMLGIWLDREPGSEDDDARQIAEGIRLAREYDEIVVAVNVGNEVLIEWTQHPVPEQRVIRYVREVRAAVEQPVTVADNYVWWRDFGADLAREVDFITMHSYPIWERKTIDEGLAFTIENYESVRAAHPGRTIVIGEAGWATYTEGNLHVPRAGDERKQVRYHRELTEWAEREGITVFFFEAFDEPWKGSGTEGHWGLFTEGRQAKPAMHERFPDLVGDGPTSPGYPERIEVSGPDIAAVLHAQLQATIRDGSVNPLGPGMSGAEIVPIDDGDGRALRLGFSGDGWAGVYLMLGEHDAGRADALVLRAKLPETVERLEVKLEGPTSITGSAELTGYETGRDGADWRIFRVPLAAFGDVDPSRLTVLGLWNPSSASGAFAAGEILIDDIRFD